MSKRQQTTTDERSMGFATAYAALNEKQRQAVDTIDGPVLVIAGPGTGKTQILTLRIARIITETDTRPEQILALTFTEAGVVAMRNRLRSYIGAMAYRVPIHTFHGLAGELIRRYPDAYPTIIGSSPLGEVERITVLEQLLQLPGISTLRPAGNPEFYLRPIIDALQTLKREAITPDEFSTYVATLEARLASTPRLHESGAHKGKVRGDYTKAATIVERNRELALVYRAYEASLRERRRYDFDDMIIETVRALNTDEAMLRDVQETYQYLLADEHQDVNGSQNELLECIAAYHDRPNIFVVGDEKQAIYRFQGASLENFLYFEDRFPGTTTISLTDNYRSGQAILDLSHSLIAVPEDEHLAALRVPLQSVGLQDTTVVEQVCSHQAIEDQLVVETIHRYLTAGVAPQEIAVIVRRNADVEQLSSVLRAAGVAVSPSADGDVLRHPIAVAVRQLITVLTQPENDEALFTVLHGAYWGIEAADLARVLAGRRRSVPLLAMLQDETMLTESGVVDTASFRTIYEVLATGQRLLVTTPPHRVVAEIVDRSGLKAFVTANDPIGSGRVLRRFYDEIERLVQERPGITLVEVAAELRQLDRYQLSLTAPFISTETSAVAILTAHKAKGLEFDVVIAPRLTDGLWGKSRIASYFSLPVLRHLDAASFDPIDDDRRLLYVLLTRAKTHIELLWSETSHSGQAQVRSRLLVEVEQSLITRHEVTTTATFDPLDTFSPQPLRSLLTPELLTTLFSQRGFSATSLNNFLVSPYTYLYRNIFRIPEVQGLSLLYGTAIHSLLEQVTRSCKTETPLTIDALPGLLQQALTSLPLSPAEYSQLHERGLTALVSYWPVLMASLDSAATTRQEVSLSVVLPSGNATIGDISLSGKLDRLDLDEEGTLIRVVDYKTGTPKTRSVIEGATKSSNGDYKRQLVFYKLLLSLHDDERLRMGTGVLSFVEPDRQGRIHEEVFTISDAEVEELAATIKNAARAFTSGEFLKESCDRTVCEYCDLVERWR